MVTEFFDSAPRVFPPGAQYAVCYFDGEFRQPAPPGIPNIRWNTVEGGAAAAKDTGVIDYELHNPAYLGRNLGLWASERTGLGFRARVYCNRSDVRPAFAQVGHLPVLWWIATLDNQPGWTPAGIVASVKAISGVELDPATIWGIQWGTNSRYDTSYLTAAW